MIPIERSCHEEHTNEMSIWPMVKFLKSGSNFKVKRYKIMVPIERSCHKETHMKYQSPITYHSKDMANVNVFENWVKLQGQGHKVKNYGTNRKVFS